MLEILNAGVAPGMTKALGTARDRAGTGPRARVVRVFLYAGLVLLLAGCGYRLAGGGSSGSGRTLAVPVFRNESSEFRIEQRLTEAVRRELIGQTRFRVVPEGPGDLVLDGRVLGVTTAPTIFTEGGRAIVYSVAVDVGIRLTDASDGSVLFENPRLTFRESFEVSNDSVEFVPEDAAAIERLARQFASSLTASLSRVNP